MKATWNNIVIAESETVVRFKNNIFFPYDSVKLQYLVKNNQSFSDNDKGVCQYYNVEVGGVVAKNGAWMCSNPNLEAEKIRDYFAFSKDIAISDTSQK